MANRLRRDRNERGATLVEAAIITPLFLLLIMGIFETTFMLHNRLKANAAVGAGGRAVTVAGSSAPADFLTLQALEHGLANFDLDDIELVVVYKADGTDDTVPAGCLSYPAVAGLDCNSYVPDDFYLGYVDGTGTPTGHWGCGPTARDTGWCPTARQDALSDPGGPDYVGLYVRIRQKNLTGMFDWDRTLEVDRIARIEPTAD